MSFRKVIGIARVVGSIARGHSIRRKVDEVLSVAQEGNMKIDGSKTLSEQHARATLEHNLLMKHAARQMHGKSSVLPRVQPGRLLLEILG